MSIHQTVDGRIATQYSVGIRQSTDMQQVSQRDILLDRVDGKIMVHIVGTDCSYEVFRWMRTDANEGKRVEVKISNNYTWYFEFNSLFKVYQFLEQLRIFHYLSLDSRINLPVEE